MISSWVYFLIPPIISLYPNATTKSHDSASLIITTQINLMDDHILISAGCDRTELVDIYTVPALHPDLGHADLEEITLQKDKKKCNLFA
jgi:hypothetical protein